MLVYQKFFSHRHQHRHQMGLVGGACDFKEKSLKKVLTSPRGDPPGERRKKCQVTNACSHYGWTDQDYGTCYLKEGALNKLTPSERSTTSGSAASYPVIEDKSILQACCRPKTKAFGPTFNEEIRMEVLEWQYPGAITINQTCKLKLPQI